MLRSETGKKKIKMNLVFVIIPRSAVKDSYQVPQGAEIWLCPARHSQIHQKIFRRVRLSWLTFVCMHYFTTLTVSQTIRLCEVQLYRNLTVYDCLKIFIISPENFLIRSDLSNWNESKTDEPTIMKSWDYGFFVYWGKTIGARSN